MVPDPLFLVLEDCVPETVPDLRTVDGILFDLDGVLTPTAEVHMRAWAVVFAEVFATWGITPAYTDADYMRTSMESVVTTASPVCCAAGTWRSRGVILRIRPRRRRSAASATARTPRSPQRCVPAA